jgi:predicted XRE-type DNA-binding protein
MDSKKRKRLEAKGWVFGDVGDFLDLTPEQVRYIDLKIALSQALKAERTKQKVTQEELAKALGSSQSRVAKMEAGDPSVSADLLLKALLALGVSKKALSKVFA